MRCLACGGEMLPMPGMLWCKSNGCSLWAERQPNRRWLIHLPVAVVPTSDWVDCPACEGTGRVECAVTWCSFDNHAGPCHNCRTLGVVRGTLDHPTTYPPQETR
jgi:hypothetical protein